MSTPRMRRRTEMDTARQVWKFGFAMLFVLGVVWAGIGYGIYLLIKAVLL